MGELEGGAGVVVEAADEAVVERVRDAGGVKGGGDGGEVGAGVFVERVGDDGQRLDDGLVGGDFAVEDAQGVGDGAALAVGTHLADNWDEGCAKGFVVAGAVGLGANGVQLEGPAGDAQFVQEGGEHFKDFGVAEGLSLPEEGGPRTSAPICENWR